jgi:hypothetical protein
VSAAQVTEPEAQAVSCAHCGSACVRAWCSFIRGGRDGGEQIGVPVWVCPARPCVEGRGGYVAPIGRRRGVGS